MSDRRIELIGTFNFRDIGGYVGQDGRPVRRGRVYRSGTLATLHDEDVAILEGLGIGRIFDLRSDSELANDGVGDFAAMHHRHTPLVEVTLSPFDPDIDWRNIDLQNRYVEMLETGGHVIAEVLEWLCRGGPDATVFHCTGGKDRTGVVAAVLLRVLGVADDDIVEDYSISEVYLRQRLDSFRDALEEIGMDEEAIAYLTSSPPSRMRHTLVELDRRWGSVTGYLDYIGVGQELAERLRRRLLD